MTFKLVPAIAHVECRSESQGDDVPIAIVFGDERLEITAVIDRAMITGAEAGEPVRHRMWVELEDGAKYRLMRVLPDGEWRVWVER